MKSKYVDPVTGTTALLSKYKGRTYTIDSIATETSELRKGGARRVMARILADADEQHVTLRLLVVPTGVVRFDDLKAWYERLGFENAAFPFHYIRLPRVKHETLSAQAFDGQDRKGQMQLGRMQAVQEARTEEA